MATAPTTPELAYVFAIVAALAYLLQYKPEDWVIRNKNADNCWYPPTCKVMENTVPRLADSDLYYTKTEAITDAQTTVNSLFNRYKWDTLPKIYQQLCVVNGFNSTSAQLLANDAYAKTVNEAAKLVLDNIKTYAGIRGSDLTVMAQICASMRNSYDNTAVAGASSQLSIKDVLAYAGTAIDGKVPILPA